MAKQQSDARVALGRDSDIKDVYSFLVDAKDPQSGEKLSHTQIVSETSLLITAGKLNFQSLTSYISVVCRYLKMTRPLTLIRIRHDRDCFGHHDILYPSQ